jgi:Cu2+-exporting ATPase
VAAHSQLSRIGVLSLRADALDTLATVDRIVLDKTGTLTRGQPSIIAVEALADIEPPQLRAIAAALQRNSGHALAVAFEGGNESPLLAESVTVTPGLGVQGRIGETEYRLGRADFAASVEDDGAIWLGDGSRGIGRFHLRDALRPDAGMAVAALRQLGVAVEISSGDSKSAVDEVAMQLGVTEAKWRQLPQDKLQRVRELQALGHRVAMLGDGINDAPVLAGADVSLAMSSGSALAHGAADLVIAGESLMRLPQSIAVARMSRRVMRQNLCWAVGYNLLALPFAAMGWVAPWMAALGMAVSSLLVTLNALRLGRAAE